MFTHMLEKMAGINPGLHQNRGVFFNFPRGAPVHSKNGFVYTRFDQFQTGSLWTKKVALTLTAQFLKIYHDF